MELRDDELEPLSRPYEPCQRTPTAEGGQISASDRMTPLGKVLQALRSTDCDPKRSGKLWRSKCPAHNDTNTSLSLSEGSDERVLVDCNAGCSTPVILESLNLKSSDLNPDDPNRKTEDVTSQIQEESSENKGRELELLPASRVTPRTTKWLWRDRLPLGGACLFAGQEGLGKTTIAVDIAARASCGLLDGDLYGEPCSIVYATAEDSWARTLRPRFEAAGADLERVHFVIIDGFEGGLEVPGDLAVGCIGHPSFDRIVEVRMRLILRIHTCRHLDGQRPVGVQLAGLFGLFIARRILTGTPRYAKHWHRWPRSWIGSKQLHSG